MKKLYILALSLIGAFAFAQTPLNTNGSLESWTDGSTQAEGWYMTASNLTNGVISRVEGGAQDGNISVKVTAPASSNNQVGLADIAVTGGQQYSVSFWYKTSGAAKFRFWGQWRDAAGALTVTDDPFQPSGTSYIEEATTEWTKVTITSTAPTNATLIRITFRNYSGSSDLYIDNVNFYQGSASVKDNNIAGLSVYPNPATGSTLFVTSNNNVEKSVAIFDVLGKQVINTVTTGAVNIANLNAGVYIVKVTEEGKTASRKLVVK